ncbi:unnamed protein product [Rhizophagus irregularis]|nr:unnamed protein product [Rhizophagus irregularis]
MPEVMWYYYVYYWFLVTAVRALKDALQTLGHVTSINATLCKIDLGREVDMTMSPGALVKDYFGGNDYPDLDPNLINILIRN